MLLDTMKQDVFTNLTFMIESPEGVVFTSILEDHDGKPVGILINVGKAGAVINAWANVLTLMINDRLDRGGTISDIIADLSSQTSDQSRTHVSGVKVRSGPEAVCVALMMYQRTKFQELSASLGVTLEDFHRESRFVR